MINTHWQPIGTAPKDGTKILIFKHGWIAAYLCRWAEDAYHGVEGWWFANMQLSNRDGLMPTHWCYPPTEEKADD